jgi:hypothetical protein
MEPWHWAIVLKPFVLLGVLFLIALLVKPFRTERSVFLSPTFRQRHPVIYGSIVVFLWLCLIVWFAIFSARLQP